MADRKHPVFHGNARSTLRRSALSVAITAWLCGRAAFAEPAAPPSMPFAKPGEMKVPYHGRFTELPVGTVKPRGWIKSWLERQADGMTGHPENLGYPFNTTMYAGKIPPPATKHGRDWWAYEQSGYFIDAATRLDALLGTPQTAAVVRPSLDYIVHNAGPAKLGESTWGWSNVVVGRALMARYDTTADPAIAHALADCVLGSTKLNGRDGLIAEQALRLYGLTADERFLAFAKRAYDSYFVSNERSFSTVDKINGPKPLHEHGVTAAEQLKLLPILYAYTGDAELLKLADTAYRKVEADALMPDGGFVSSEFLGTAAFDSMHETCDITDWSWSMGYQLLASGDAHWADRIEQATFNALPGAVTKDFKQVQYFSSPNQVLASSSSCVDRASTRMWYRPSHDTECCTGNVNRAMPNYVSRMWARTPDGIAALLLGPCEVTADVQGKPVTITEETDYPFRDTITFKVKTATPAAFTLALRVPQWCESATVAVNGTATDESAKAGTFVMLKREFKDGDTVTLKLPMAVKTREWYGGRAASVERGPLVYSLKLEETAVVSKEDPPAIARALKGNTLVGFPAYEYFPAAEWRFGLDAGEAKSSKTFTVTELPVADNPFDPATPPVRIAAAVRPLPQWAAGWSAAPGEYPANTKTATKTVAALPDAAAAASAGPEATVTLIPLGATHLRLTTFPLTARP